MSVDKWIMWFISLFCGVFCLADLIGNVSYYIGVWRMKKKIDVMEKELGVKIPLFCGDTLLLTVTNAETFEKVEQVVVVNNGQKMKEFILRTKDENK
ncbi:MAG: hypothetical protein IKS59_06790 [Aeriscardovia sp.]|nr:hypothetical protein [Aeriscardovia sp.]